MKMYYSSIILCVSLSILSCKAATLDYSNITPWSIVYAVYPVYDSEPWVEVWKNERPLDISTSRIDFRLNDLQRSDSTNIHKETTDNNNSQQDSHASSRDNQNSNSNQQTQSWPSNYRNWPKSTNKADH